MALPTNLATGDLIDETWVDSVTTSLAGISGATDAAFLAAIRAALDVRYAPVPTAWTNVTVFTNSWVSYGAGYTPQYRKVGDEVQMRGLMKLGSISVAAFTLPVGFRPAYEETFPQMSNGAFGAVSVAVSGVVTPQPPTNTAYVYLSGIRFSTVA